MSDRCPLCRGTGLLPDDRWMFSTTETGPAEWNGILTDRNGHSYINPEDPLPAPTGTLDEPPTGPRLLLTDPRVPPPKTRRRP